MNYAQELFLSGILPMVILFTVLSLVIIFSGGDQ